MEELRQKPIFGTMAPPGRYKDITLPYSLGLLPARIARWLRQYQLDGSALLHELFVYQKGGILRDDMGLPLSLFSSLTIYIPGKPIR